MGLFKADFYRSFIVGFGVGAIAVFTLLGSEPAASVGGVVRAAHAASPQD